MNGENVFRQKYTRISGLSAIRRLPRLGKIRLGIKVQYSTKLINGIKEPLYRPKEVDYFVCPAEIKKFYGDEPKELSISFPMNDPEVIFPQCYKWYGSSMGLKCRGDGETALRLNEETKEMEEKECPCELLEEGKCKQRASLVFMMPGIKIGGVYQIDLSSYHSIVDINSGIDYARALLNDQIAFVPFKLKRVPKETHAEGKKQIHYTLQLELDINAKELSELQNGKRLFYGQNKQYMIEAPEEDKNPAYDSKKDGAVIEEETEEETKAREEKDIADKETVKKDIDESKTREADLKKAKEAGKTSLRTPAEIKKSLEKRNNILEEIQDTGKKYGLLNWRDIIDLGVRYKIFFSGIVASQAKTYVVDHPDKREELIKVIKEDQEITEDDIPPDDREPLEVIDEEAPYPDEKEGNSYDNPIKTNLKRKSISNVEDFIAPGDMPE